MGKKLAIKGHSTRGKEVIELLKMMGGTNPFTINDGVVIGNKETSCYHIAEDSATKYISWDYIGSEEIDKYEIFTLEEFFEKYPFRLGDKVYTKSNAEGTIIDMFWDGIEVLYQLSSESANTLGYFHRNELKLYKEEVNIKENKLFGTASKPVESKSNAVSLKDGKVIDNSIDAVQFMQMGKTVSVIFNSENYEDEVELQLGDYAIEVRDGKTYAVLKKPTYPKTYAECCRVMGFYPNTLKWDNPFCINKDTHPYIKHFDNLIESFCKLLVCRDAYWEIAGEKMGLGKPWKHSYLKDANTIRYAIYNTGDEIVKIDGKLYRNYILCFTTEEMRDAFYENFKDLIEQCKELL